MTPSFQIRRIALIAAIGCAFLASSTSAASARVAEDYMQSASTAPSNDSTMLIVVATFAVLVVVGTAGSMYRRARTTRRALV
jgi:hypothetical protein